MTEIKSEKAIENQKKQQQPHKRSEADRFERKYPQEEKTEKKSKQQV